MHNLTFQRLIGFTLIVSAALGATLALVGLVALWRGEASLRASLLRWLDNTDQTITTTLDSLALADRSLAQLDSTVGSIKTALDESSRAVGDTTPTLKTAERAVGIEAPRVMKESQTALRSAQTAARGIDDILANLARIPVLGLGAYRPAVPLSISLGQVADSLDTLFPTLIETEVGLAIAGKNLDKIQIDLITVSSSLTQAQDSLKSARPLLAQYEASLRAAQSELNTVRAGLPGWLTAAKWGGMFLLLWFALAQLGLVVQGMGLLGQGEMNRR